MSKTNKRAIVSFANSKGYYIDRLARLSNSLRNNFDGDFLGFIHEASLGCELHEINPYAFKIVAFQKAIDYGYTSILWLDSSVFAVAPVEPIFEYIETNGHIAQDAGHMLGTWCNDETLDYFNMSREEADKIKMIGNAGFLGLDFTKHSSASFFEAWKQSMVDGMFKGSWDNHRHDMSCSSLLWHRSGFSKVNGNEILQYAGIYDKVLNDTIILKAQG